MRIICVGFYDLTSTIITTRGRISPWSETPHFRHPPNNPGKRLHRSDGQPITAGRDAPLLTSRSSQAAQLMFEKKASMYFGRSAGA